MHIQRNRLWRRIFLNIFKKKKHLLRSNRVSLHTFPSEKKKIFFIMHRRGFFCCRGDSHHKHASTTNVFCAFFCAAEQKCLCLFTDRHFSNTMSTFCHPLNHQETKSFEVSYTNWAKKLNLCCILLHHLVYLYADHFLLWLFRYDVMEIRNGEYMNDTNWE